MEKQLEVLLRKCEQVETMKDNELNSVKSITDDAISNMQV
jgi:hypothetical protein